MRLGKARLALGLAKAALGPGLGCAALGTAVTHGGLGADGIRAVTKGLLMAIRAFFAATRLEDLALGVPIKASAAIATRFLAERTRWATTKAGLAGGTAALRAEARLEVLARGGRAALKAIVAATMTRA